MSSRLGGLGRARVLSTRRVSAAMLRGSLVTFSYILAYCKDITYYFCTLWEGRTANRGYGFTNIDARSDYTAILTFTPF